jgi:hypothetical protein
MIYYLLKVSNTRPLQFKIEVLQESGVDPMNTTLHTALSEQGFTGIGIYKTPEDLTDALEPYLHMEASK